MAEDINTNNVPLVKRTERGWAGHFCCSRDCLFRRNTLLQCSDKYVVVSTVGLMQNPLFGRSDRAFPDMGKDVFSEIGYKRYFETMAFHARDDDTRYHDADVSRGIFFNSKCSIGIVDADDEANLMHEAVVEELTKRLLSGEDL